MRIFIQLLLIVNGWTNSQDIDLPDPFKHFGNQLSFKNNSIKWVKNFANTAEVNSQYLKALHAWFYLYKNNNEDSKFRIDKILVKTNQSISRLLFLAHSQQLHKLTLNFNEQQDLNEFFDYFKFRHGIYTNQSISKDDFPYNKYVISESYFQQHKFQEQLIFLNVNHHDPYGILAYHKVRTEAILNDCKLNQHIPDEVDVFFKSHLKIFHRSAFPSRKKQLLMDIEQLEFLLRTTNYIPDMNTLNSYPYLVLTMMTKRTFQWNDSTWNLFLQLLQNPFWQPKIKSEFAKNNHLNQSLQQVLYLLNHQSISNQNIKQRTSIVNNIKFTHDADWPSPLLKTIFNAAYNINTAKSEILSVSWANIKTPFVYDLFTNELILSYESITWSKKIWSLVLARNHFHYQLLQRALKINSKNQKLIPIWILDSISNVKTQWTPEIHGMNLSQTSNLSLYPLSYSSLHNSIRNHNRKSLFFAYHWQCRQIGTLLFKDYKSMEIVKILASTNTFNTESQFYNTMSKLFGGSPKDLRSVFAQ